LLTKLAALAGRDSLEKGQPSAGACQVSIFRLGEGGICAVQGWVALGGYILVIEVNDIFSFKTDLWQPFTGEYTTMNRTCKL